MFKTRVTIEELQPNQGDDPAFQVGCEVLILDSTSNQYHVGAISNPLENSAWRYKSQIKIEVVEIKGLNKTAVAVLHSIYWHGHSISLQSENGETIRCELPQFGIDEVVRIDPRKSIMGNLEMSGCFDSDPELKPTIEKLLLAECDYSTMEHQYFGELGNHHREIALYIKQFISQF